LCLLNGGERLLVRLIDSRETASLHVIDTRTGQRTTLTAVRNDVRGVRVGRLSAGSAMDVIVLTWKAPAETKEGYGELCL
jgi:hypothetical protein